jgi:choline dehydrogenase-like flavoprotein
MIPASLEQGPRRTGNTLVWGRAHHVAFQKRYRRTSSVMIICSELAENDNRVELHPSLTDDFGIPAPKLIYKRSENTEKLLAYAMERGKELMEAAGAVRVDAGVERDSAGRGAAPGHYMGTARMGTDPRRSVVDKWGRAHDVRNLFIIDGSVFTTSGSYVPTSTIQAIALRTADYIKNNVKQLFTT